MSHVEPQQPVYFQSLCESAYSSSAHPRAALLNSATQRCLFYDDAVMTVPCQYNSPGIPMCIPMSLQLTGNPHVHPCISPDTSVTAPWRLSVWLVSIQAIRAMSASVAILAVKTLGSTSRACPAGQGASMASSTTRAAYSWQLQERDRDSAAAYVLPLSNCK